MTDTTETPRTTTSPLPTEWVKRAAVAMLELGLTSGRPDLADADMRALAAYVLIHALGKPSACWSFHDEETAYKSPDDYVDMTDMPPMGETVDLMVSWDTGYHEEWTRTPDGMRRKLEPDEIDPCAPLSDCAL